MVYEGIRDLGPPPVEFAVVAVGDLASRNVGLYPRLDFAILMESDEGDASAYFHTLSTLVYLMVIALGETEVKVFGTVRNEYGLSFGLFTPVHFPNEALGTPDKLATLALTSPSSDSSGGSSSPTPHAPQSHGLGIPIIPASAVDYSVFCRTFLPVRLVAGDPSLVTTFEGLVGAVLETPTVDMSYSALRTGVAARPVTPVVVEDVDEMFVSGSVVRHVLATAMIREAIHAFYARRSAPGAAVSVPYLHVRPLVWDVLQSLVHGLAFYFEVDESDSSWVAVEQLTSQGVLAPDFSSVLMRALDDVFSLRLRLAVHYGTGRELATSQSLTRAHADRVGSCRMGGSCGSPPSSSSAGRESGQSSTCGLTDLPLLSGQDVYELSDDEQVELETAVQLSLVLVAELERLVSGVLPYSTPLLGHSLARLLDPAELGYKLLYAQTAELLHAYADAKTTYEMASEKIAKAGAQKQGTQQVSQTQSQAETQVRRPEDVAISAWLSWRIGRAEMARLANGMADPKHATRALYHALDELGAVERLSLDPAKQMALEGDVAAGSAGGTPAAWLVWSLMGLYSRPAMQLTRALILVHLGVAHGAGGETREQRRVLKDALTLLTGLGQGSRSVAARTYSAVALQRAVVVVYVHMGRVEMQGKALALASGFLTSALNKLRSSSLRGSCPSPHAATGVEAYGMSFSEASASAGLAPFWDAHISVLYQAMSDLMAARGDGTAAKDYAVRGIQVQEHHLRRDGFPHAALGAHYVQMGNLASASQRYSEALDWFGWAMQVFEQVYAPLLVDGSSSECGLTEPVQVSQGHVAMAHVHFSLADALYQLGYFEMAELHYGYVIQIAVPEAGWGWGMETGMAMRTHSPFSRLALLTAKAQEALGAICNIQERFAEAAGCYQDALKVYGFLKEGWTTELVPLGRSTGSVARGSGSGNEDDRKRRVSDLELDGARCAFNYGFVVKALGRGGEARDAFGLAHGVFVRVLGSTHPDTLLAASARSEA